MRSSAEAGCRDRSRGRGPRPEPEPGPEPGPGPGPQPAADAPVLGLAVLGRWPVLEYRLHRLPDGPDGPLHDRAPSMALVVTFEHPAGPLHIATACPDWQADRGGARLAQNRGLTALLTDPALDGPLPVVLAADLNARPDTPELRPLARAFVDAWDAVRPGQPGFTFTTGNGFVGSHEWLADGRIDHILARPGTPGRAVSVQAAALAGTADPAPSDHYAVVADLGWCRSGLVKPREGRSHRSGKKEFWCSGMIPVVAPLYEAVAVLLVCLCQSHARRERCCGREAYLQVAGGAASLTGRGLARCESLTQPL
ncbi:endonuclease/exonuclease/phosphatase family protein [Streptomyces sp. NBC_01352]|uniref:endonuclease/exonuclease/phosphatase family protein n=1 Tax=Streptomyces sp. NBC_01352 TaxID=2903834 RepID=UPI002E34DD45|nr:endonuclease/exonuclease/phosphatase family protein [Streptomyces sp. NBC_01352]